MTERGTVWTQQYSCEHDKQSTFPIPLVPPCASPPPKPTGGLTAFPDSAPKIFSFPQNLLTLQYNLLKLQPQNFGMWRRLKRIFAMLAKERKETKETLWEFLGLEDDGDEVEICAKILTMQRFEEWFLCFNRKSPPNEISTAWLLAEIPRFLRAPGPCLRVAG
jgi:hypothetical protein